MHLFRDVVPIMTKLAKPVKFSQPESFEAALAELENIVVEMEAGQMPLEVSLSAHRRGAELLQYCQSKLQDAQQQIRLHLVDQPEVRA